jgi:hypothetical protein
MPNRNTPHDSPSIAIEAARPDEVRLEHLINRLPGRLQETIHWLRRPSSRWARLQAGVMLIGGGVLGALPLLGFWMLPLGLVLLAEDAPPLRRRRDLLLSWIERRWPQLLRGKPQPTNKEHVHE